MIKRFFIVSITCLIIILSLHFFGKGKRTYHDAVAGYIPCDDAYQHLERIGLKGRAIVGFSKYLHFMAIHESNLVDVYQNFPLEIPDLKQTIKTALNEENFLWEAVEDGVARKIYHVIPENTLFEKIEAAKEFTEFNVKQGEPYEVKGDVIEGHYRHAPRYILTLKDLPRLDEPVVLFFHPSFFEFDEGPDDVINTLKNRGMRYDSAIFCGPDRYENKAAAAKLERLKWLMGKNM